MPPRRGARGRGACGRGARDTRSTRAHPAPAIEDPIPKVLIQPPIAPVPPVAPVPPPVLPSEPAVLVTESLAPSAAPVPPPEASAAPVFPTMSVGAEHFQQLMQAITAALQTRQPTAAQEQRAMEFETLVQGDMTVLQYEARFLALSRFAPILISDEMMRARRFQNGLRPALCSRVSSGGDQKRRAPTNSSRQHRQQRRRGKSEFLQPAAQTAASSSSSVQPAASSSGPFSSVSYGCG
ncbi:pollen-specific leucine-rich repeat extensin-like protein 2 [Magnolia sinica]|uniref:pollen-specific leucine-rich repeat extensin-like protein 2 n=1 Tax=Magnolia sinica TaxID=86752 RepID=UPI002658D550|nr:pollen-specific leucine-rich repeat extensin-like protein 2 [Magnolia sinica]